MNRLSPILFVGHGNPMHAITHNAFTESLKRLGHTLHRPKAILSISAHWLTTGTWVTAMKHPRTIHDFRGFPKELFEVQYPALGSPELADEIIKTIKNVKVLPDKLDWGLDHGTWAILKHLFPKADIPVVQLSINLSQGSDYHFRLGEELQSLREQGVLIIGSGNIVHNLHQADFSPSAKSLGWAIEFDERVKECLLQKAYPALVNDAINRASGKLSIPTPDHWHPMLYVLGAATKQDTLRFEYEGIEHGTISMRSFSYGIYP